jgi:hypothetical protein
VSALRFAASEEFTAPATPPPKIPRSLEEPTDTPQTSLDTFNSGNKFEPGETVTERSTENSPETSSPATQTAAPTTSDTAGGSPPADEEGGTGHGHTGSPGNDESGRSDGENSLSPRRRSTPQKCWSTTTTLRCWRSAHVWKRLQLDRICRTPGMQQRSLLEQ